MLVIMLIASIALYLVVFFYLYILVMGIYRAYLAGRLSPFLLTICTPAVIIGAMFDIFCNIFIATVVFRKLPQEWLVTTRLTKIQNNPLEHIHNRALAKYLCNNMLDIFDPYGSHCTQDKSLFKR